MMTKDKILEYYKMILDSDANVVRNAKKELRDLRLRSHQNVYIAPYDMLPYSCHEYDESYSKAVYTYLKMKCVG